MRSVRTPCLCTMSSRTLTALLHYFSTTATQHMGALTAVAKPGLHLGSSGIDIPASVREAVSAKAEPAAFGALLFGYVRNNYRLADPKTAIQVTAKWTCKPSDVVSPRRPQVLVAASRHRSA